MPLDPERETRLIAAAASAFIEVGYDLASLNHIIAEAGLSKSSFYHYFPDKQHLHDHVVTTLRERLAQGLQLPRLDEIDADSYWPAMTAALSSVAATMAADPQTRLLGQMFHHPLAARGPDGRLTGLREDVEAWLTHAVSIGRRLGTVRNDLPESLVVDLAFGTLTVLTSWALSHPAESGHWPELVTELLVGTLALEPPA